MSSGFTCTSCSRLILDTRRKREGKVFFLGSVWEVLMIEWMSMCAYRNISREKRERDMHLNNSVMANDVCRRTRSCHHSRKELDPGSDQKKEKNRTSRSLARQRRLETFSLHLRSLTFGYKNSRLKAPRTNKRFLSHKFPNHVSSGYKKDLCDT